jgi:hypothetical protein
LKSVWAAWSASADGRPFTSDTDQLLVGVAGSGQFVISTDPTATVANRLTTPTTGFYPDVIYGCSLNAAMPAQLNYELKRGDIIYLSRTGAGGFLLLFENLPIVLSS